MLYKIAVSIATDITPLINLSVLLSTNNATAVENGTILQSAADRLHHPKLHHSPKVVITIPGEPQRNSEANELNTTLNAPEDTFYCETVDDVSQRGEIFTTLHLKHRSGQLKLKVDTGAKCNVISAQQLHLIVPAAHINTNEKVNLIAYGGQTINTEGTTILDCEQGQLKFHVVDRSVRPLLGLQDTIAMGLIQLGPHVHAVANQEPEVQEFSDLFDTTALGKLPVVYHMRLDESVAPNVCAPRKVPIAMEKVMAELERMTKLGVKIGRNRGNGMGVCHGRCKKERWLCKDMYRSSTPQQSTPEATSSIKNYRTGHC